MRQTDDEQRMGEFDLYPPEIDTERSNLTRTSILLGHKPRYGVAWQPYSK